MPLKFDNNGRQWIRWRHRVSSIVLGPRQRWSFNSTAGGGAGVKWTEEGKKVQLIITGRTENWTRCGPQNEPRIYYIVLHSAIHYKGLATGEVTECTAKTTLMMMICYKSIFLSHIFSRKEWYLSFYVCVLLCHLPNTHSNRKDKALSYDGPLILWGRGERILMRIFPFPGEEEVKAIN